MPDFDCEKRISQYVKLRDKIKDIKDRHKEELKPYEEAMAKLEDLFLGYLNETNQQKASSQSGTVYKTIKTNVSIADGTAFRRHVIGMEQWDLIDWKANVTAVGVFLEEHQEPPPGLNVSRVARVNVRRS